MTLIMLRVIYIYIYIYIYISAVPPHLPTFYLQVSDVADETKRKINQAIFQLEVIIGVFVLLHDACIAHTKSLKKQQHNNMTLIWCLLEQNNCKLIIMTHDYLTIQFYCFVREMGAYVHKK